MARAYKEQLLSQLIVSGWEQTSVCDECDDWFLDEQWRMRSVRESWGIEILISFLVDPSWEGIRKKNQGVWYVCASEQSPDYCIPPKDSISALSMSKGLFNDKLADFVSEINEFRHFRA